MIYWVTFQDSKTPAVCIVLRSSDASRARHLAREYKKAEPDQVFNLPYPATPCIVNETGFPTFCLSGDECKGRTSCPRSYACSE